MGHGRRARRPTLRRGLALGLVLPALALEPGQAVTKPALATRAAPPDSHGPHVDLRRAAVHELHETYADLAIEGATVGGQIRFYKSDLERALGPMVGADAVTLTPGPEADALMLRYLTDHLVLRVDGDTLDPTIIRSGEEMMEHHEGWWVAVHYEAAVAIDSLHVTNTLLFEVHDDQRNIMRFVHFPEETRETVTLEAEAPEAVVKGW